MQTITGNIISVKNLKSNTFHYFIKDKNGNMNKYVYFGNSHDTDGLDTSREVTIEFEVRDGGKYGKSNIIKKFVHGDRITNTKLIGEFLVKEIGLPILLAHKLIDSYGDKTLDTVFKETDKLAEIKHLNIDSYIEKIKQYQIRHENIDFRVKLSDLGINIKYHDAIIKLMGSDLEKIKNNIYDLYFVIKMPFDKCDDIALKLGYAKNNHNRIDAFIDDTFKKLDRSGILYESYDIIQQKCTAKKIPIGDVIPKLIKLCVDDTDYYTSQKIDSKEKFVEDVCIQLVNKNPVIFFDPCIQFNNDKINIRQDFAIKNALSNSISIVTGGPGTGKSFIIGSIAQKLCINTMIYVLAPTGAAVERLRKESDINKSAQIITLQSFIYNNKKKDIDDHDKNYQNNNFQSIYQIYEHVDEIIFFIDEMSMVDLSMFCQFLKIMQKIITKVRIILLGDANQLPSIQGGYVLNDLISSGIIPYTVLVQNYRSNEDIKHNSKLALNGDDLEPNKDFTYIRVNSSSDIKIKLLNLLKEQKIKYENSCILIPTRKGGIGINAFNPVLQKFYNSKSSASDTQFRIGDKIIQGKNNRDKGVYNGSILVVDGFNYVDKEDGLIKLRCKYFQDECNINSDNKDFTMVSYKNKSEIDEDKLDLAYAMTVHKAQGKGYDTVIIIIYSSMYSPMLNRNMLYTAITRAKNKCIIIGDDVGLLECKKLMVARITNLFNGRIPKKDIVKDLISIDNNLSKVCESNFIIDLFKEHDINPYHPTLFRKRFYDNFIKNKSFRDQILLFTKQNFPTLKKMCILEV